MWAMRPRPPIVSKIPEDIFEGYFADITIVDPSKLSDASTICKCGWSPFTQFNSTVVHTLVNGVPVVRDSQLTGLKSSLPLSFND